MLFKKTIFLFIALGIFIVVLYALLREPRGEELQPDLPTPTSYQAPSSEKPTEEPKEVPPTELPKEFLLSVPFTPQAPTANWDELHNEACEEASALMVNAFFQGDVRRTMPAAEAESEIEKLTEWQQKNLGYYLSIDAEEVARMIESVYGLQAEVVRDFSENSIKTALTENKLVLAPVNGRALGNPYFKQPGPIYHMFVIKGYDKKSFIVNEPGTKRGQDYRYTYDTIKNAIGDYDHSTKETDPSKSAIIVVSK